MQVAAGLRDGDSPIKGVSQKGDTAKTVQLQATVIADDEDAVRTAIVRSLEQQGVRVISAKSKSTVGEPKAVNARGVEYDLATGTMTIETGAPVFTDLSIKLVRGKESIVGIMAGNRGGRQVEDSFAGLLHIVIRRPGGNFNQA